ncbi:hypothetical protein ACRYHF_00105 [Stutzerimonas balearica]|uniref:hypothetical protein n=1 Tax=Stutzerimonas balearica TaxID=74829 RepID=UPI003F5CBA0E
MSKARAIPISIAPCVQATPVWLGTAASLEASARWGYGAAHDGEHYRLDLCESCFFGALTYLRGQSRIHTMFDDDQPTDDQVFGRVARDDFLGES